jgi:RodZ C-terminal domain
MARFASAPMKPRRFAPTLCRVGSAEHHTDLPRSGSGLGRHRTCTVKRWRGYRMLTFYAELESGGVIAESGPFRERKRTDDPSPATASSHRELLAHLEELGWERTGEGGREWYEVTLRRPLEAWELEVAEAAVDDAPPPPPPPTKPTELSVQPVRPRVPQVAPEARRAPPEAPPARAPASARTTTMRWRKTAVTVAGLAIVAAATSIAVASSGPSRPQLVPSRPATAHAATAHATAARRATPPAATPAPAAAAPAASPVLAPPRVHVTIAARSRPSWLEVRRRSARGAVLFSGELGAGRRLRFTGSRLWARFGAAGNLSISVDGKPLVLQGTYEHVFAARRTSR